MHPALPSARRWRALASYGPSTVGDNPAQEEAHRSETDEESRTMYTVKDENGQVSVLGEDVSPGVVQSKRNSSPNRPRPPEQRTQYEE